MPIFVSKEEAIWASSVLSAYCHHKERKFPCHVRSRAMILWNEWKKQKDTEIAFSKPSTFIPHPFLSPPSTFAPPSPFI